MNCKILSISKVILVLQAQAKKDIAKVAECEVSDVNLLLKNYRVMKDMQMWLKSMKDKGEPLPADQEELTNRFRMDRPTNSRDLLAQKREMRFSRRDYKRMIKWGQNAVINLKRRDR